MLNNREKFIVDKFSISEDDLVKIRKIGEKINSNKYSVWLARELDKYPNILNDTSLIYKIIDFIKNKNIDISDFQNSLDFNGDKNINFYKNYNTDVNKLIFAYQLQDKTEFVIGTDIHNFMNMILKTEINKTLQNSLNLFAINF